MKHKAEDVETLKEKLVAQKKKLVIGVFIFLGIVFLITGFYIYNLKQESDAKELEYEAYKALFQRKFSQAGDLFVKAYEKKKKIIYLMNAGYSYSLAEDSKKAIEYLNKVAGMNDEAFSNLAKFKIAMIYLKNNDKEQAIKVLKEIVSGKSLVMKDVSLFELAKITENKEEARKYYEEIISKFPDSAIVEEAKEALKNLSN
ncbi:putative negative regulator of RcsB-dependent stress response [Thermodesulfovibrio aggregans]|uniref:Putative negative regulator of RcsB-dependent stress response n=1 Tax=Thermodesulfovibrio aggregans TaxID=86166 RepID=A0A0U9HPW4_9BACT|nr:tetratricopeptide repeat protein [Thermodesulfovibrio aggregans]GAQ95035.1 putative negative regulator of RcsB-dependent stress response [Thermodesulfovibrio aggregans]